MKPAEQALLAYMLEISARAYPSGPLEHLEYALWYAVVNGPMIYGRYQITAQDIDRLRALSYACNGWIYFDRQGRETWATLAEWQDIFSRNFDLVRMD